MTISSILPDDDLLKRILWRNQKPVGSATNDATISLGRESPLTIPFLDSYQIIEMEVSFFFRLQN